MKHLIKRLNLATFLFLFCAFPIAFADHFVAGKDYQVLPSAGPSATATIPAEPGKISVVEFFSYGCPWCFKTQSVLEPWLKAQPKDVSFSRVPVVFEASWTLLARAYYVALALGVEPTFTPAFFKAIHEQGLNVNSQQVLETFFIQQGVSKQDFESAFSHSPVIDADMARGKALMMQYQVIAIPTFVINGQYETNPMMTGGDLNKLMQVLEYLVQKSQAPAAAS